MRVQPTRPSARRPLHQPIANAARWLACLAAICLLITCAARAQQAEVQLADMPPAVGPAELEELAKRPDALRAALRQQTLIASLSIFVLAIFVGFEVITKVPPTLHTPLMSGSNAISGITLVGAVIGAGEGRLTWITAVAVLAVILASINVVGGFLVTHRMLAMFQRR